MTITLNIDCLLELVKVALLVVRFEFQIPNYILSKDDVLARAKRYSPDDKNSEDCKDGENNYSTNGRYMLQMLTPGTYKKQRKYRFRKHGCS